MPLSDETRYKFVFLMRRMNNDSEATSVLNSLLTEMAGYRAKLESAASVFAGFMPEDTKREFYGLSVPQNGKSEN